MKKDTLDFIRNYAKNRSANTTDALPDGILEGEVPGYPGLLSREYNLRENLNFSIPLWPDADTHPFLDDLVSVWWKNFDDTEWGTPIYNFTVVAPGPETVVNIAQGRRPAGRYQIKYGIEVRGVDNYSESDPQTVVVDLTPPYAISPDAPPAPIPPADLPTPADRDYFESKPNESAVFTIPDYVAHGRADGDWAYLYYNGSDTPYAPNPPDPSPRWNLPADLSFPLPLSVVDANPDGLRNLRYELFDAAGNWARLSTAYEMDVGLFPAPENLLAPLVDRTSPPGDVLIDRADVALDGGMIVRIPEYTNFLRGVDGDEFLVTLRTSITTVNLEAQPLGNSRFPAEVYVPYRVLEILYGATRGLLPLTVSYVVRRRSVNNPATPTTTVNLDLFVVGPTPIGPDPINDDLLPVVVNGVDATGTEGPDDELERDHANRPAIARVTLWSTAPTPDASDFTIRLYYSGELVATQPVTGASAGQVIPLSIPWSFIERHGNGRKTVFYTIAQGASTNRQFSPDTTVTVNANFKELAPPVVRHLSDAGAINCTTFRPENPPGNVVVFIPPSEHFELRMVVTLHWQGYSDNAGMVAVPAAVGRVDSIPLTQAMINSGFELLLGPYETIYKPIQPHSGARLAGSARIWYTINLPEGPLPSDEAHPLVRGVRIGGTNGFFCDGTAVPLP